MAIEHKDIPDAGRHEPKGASTASAGQVYVSDGAGSGTWKSPQIVGQEVSVVNSIPVADGSGGVTWEEALYTTNYGAVVASNLTQVVPLTGGPLTTSGTFVTLNQYFTVRNVGGDITTDATKQFIIAETGIYRVTGWISFDSSVGGPSGPTFGLDVGINGVYAGSGSPVVRVKSRDASDIMTVNGFGILPFTAGDVISLGVGATVTTNLTLREGVFDIFRVA